MQISYKFVFYDISQYKHMAISMDPTGHIGTTLHWVSYA